MTAGSCNPRQQLLCCCRGSFGLTISLFVIISLTTSWLLTGQIARAANYNPLFKCAPVDAFNYERCGRRLISVLQPGRRRGHSRDYYTHAHLDDGIHHHKNHTRGSQIVDREASFGRRRPFHGEDRVVAGYPAVPGEYPWYATLITKNIGVPHESICGGVIIHSNLVLTAAHCVTDPLGRSPEKITVHVGQTSWSDRRNEQYFYPRAVTRHQFYRYNSSGIGPFLFDVGLIKINGEMRYNRYVQPACLPERTSNKRSSSNCAQAGMGLWAPNRNANTLQAIPLREAGCPEFRYDQVCFETSNPSKFPGRTCQGDSGAAVYCSASPDNGRFYAVALTSLGPSVPCQPGPAQAVQYTDLTALLPNIVDMISAIKDQ